MVGEAFMGEEGTMVQGVPYEQGVAYFRIVTQMCYNAGRLYASSENAEAVIAFWPRHKDPFAHLMPKLVYNFAKKGELPALFRVLKNLKGFHGYEHMYKNSKGYVGVFLLAVAKEHQGKGYMRRMLKHPFGLARRLSVPCVLNTDSSLKVAKYERCGMHMVKRYKVDDVGELYVMQHTQ